MSLIVDAFCIFDRCLGFLGKAATAVFVFNLHKHERHVNKEQWCWYAMCTLPFTRWKSLRSPPFKQGCDPEKE